MIIPLDLSNFVNAGILDPNLNEAAAQAALHSSSPLPSEEWVNVEDWYSDEEQSETDAVQTNKEIQLDPPVSRSVRISLPLTVITVLADAASGLTASHPCTVSPVCPSVVAIAPQSGAHLQKPPANPSQHPSPATPWGRREEREHGMHTGQEQKRIRGNGAYHFPCRRRVVHRHQR